MSAVPSVRDVILLASGPSVRGYNLRDLERRGMLVAINGAALYTKPDVAFTMDRLVAEYCYPMWQIQGVPVMVVRECIAKNFKIGPRTKVFQHDGPDVFMTDIPGKLNGSNTGTCALNLAFQMRPKRVFLLGYDMQRGSRHTEPYWHPTYPWNSTGGSKDGKLAQWAEEFKLIAPQFQDIGTEVFVINDWNSSRITAFPRIRYATFEELTDAH